MALHIIIDGYNLIRQSPLLERLDRRDLLQGRERLIQELALYKKHKRHRITVVFDGAGTLVSPQRQDRISGIAIRFSQAGESADAVIKRMAAREREKALIVSSDRDIAGFAASQGAIVISSREFGAKMVQSADSFTDETLSPAKEGWRPSTKKRGPGRRLSKRERQDRIKTRKL